MATLTILHDKKHLQKGNLETFSKYTVDLDMKIVLYWLILQEKNIQLTFIGEAVARTLFLAKYVTLYQYFVNASPNIMMYLFVSQQVRGHWIWGWPIRGRAFQTEIRPLESSWPMSWRGIITLMPRTRRQQPQVCVWVCGWVCVRVSHHSMLLKVKATKICKANHVYPSQIRQFHNALQKAQWYTAVEKIRDRFRIFVMFLSKMSF